MAESWGSAHEDFKGHKGKRISKRDKREPGKACERYRYVRGPKHTRGSNEHEKCALKRYGGGQYCVMAGICLRPFFFFFRGWGGSLAGVVREN